MSIVKLNKKYGQHLLRNPGIVDNIVEKSGIKETDVILEVGGGTGNLTIKLLEKARKVVCYEKDERLALELVKRLSDKPELKKKLDLRIGDAIKMDFPSFDMVIANIPYQISSPLIFKLLKLEFRKAVLMVQKEFGNRLIAKCNSTFYSRLSVTTQILANTRCLINVNKKNFNPPPKVDSMVVEIEPKRKEIKFFKEFDNLVRVCFGRKNKTLRVVLSENNILKRLGITKNKVYEILNSLEFMEKRAAKVELEGFLELMVEFKEAGIDLTKL